MTAPAPCDPSWWFAEALAWDGAPAARSLVGETVVDVVIVGGGYTGLWTALALHQRAPHLSVALIEREICGAGASGKNGGKAHGYWASLPDLATSIGSDAALKVARLGSRAQDAIRAFATSGERDIWWREGGNLCVSAAPAQDAKIDRYVRVARDLGVPDSALALSTAEVRAICVSPVFRGGVFFPESATLHPGRLARELRRAVLAAGVKIYEHTPMTRFDAGDPGRVQTPNGQIIARDVVLATNVELARLPPVRRHVSVFSSYALMTEPAPERIEAMAWRGDLGLADLRMFLHYFRKTPDGRVLMGSGSGPISYGGNTTSAALTRDVMSARRAERGLRRLLPALDSIPVARTWGGAIDVAADRLPIIRTLPFTRVHYACGFSGHGVNPTYIAGQTLASLVLREKDDWMTSAFVSRDPPRLPPEPFRAFGGRLVRNAILRCEEAEEANDLAPALARAVAALPKLMGLPLGTR